MNFGFSKSFRDCKHQFWSPQYTGALSANKQKTVGIDGGSLVTTDSLTNSHQKCHHHCPAPTVPGIMWLASACMWLRPHHCQASCDWLRRQGRGQEMALPQCVQRRRCRRPTDWLKLVPRQLTPSLCLASYSASEALQHPQLVNHCIPRHSVTSPHITAFIHSWFLAPFYFSSHESPFAILVT